MTTGLLPVCSTNRDVAPCVQPITESPDPVGNLADLWTVSEQMLFPPDDPKWRSGARDTRSEPSSTTV